MAWFWLRDGGGQPAEFPVGALWAVAVDHWAAANNQPLIGKTREDAAKSSYLDSGASLVEVWWLEIYE